MKIRLNLLAMLCCALALGVRAQEPASAPAPVPDALQLTADQLDQLVGPIALYPDALIALILPAATAPADIVLAARYLKDDGDPVEVASRSWDESVKSLVHYQALVKWLDDNLTWTKQLGEAFRDQPAEVMKAIQRMRARARDIGALTNTAQQSVVLDGDFITIVPTQPDVIYMPYYDPAIVYGRPAGYYTNPFLTFSVGFAVGPWLTFDCDWRSRTVWTVDHHWNHPDHRDWRHPVFPGQPGFVTDPYRHPWRPLNNSPHPTYANVIRAHQEIARPIPNANPPPARSDFADHRGDGRNRPADANRPAVAANTFVGPTAAPTVAPQPDRRFDPARGRDQSNRSLTLPGVVAANPVAPTQPAPAFAPVATATAPQPGRRFEQPREPPPNRSLAMPNPAAPVNPPSHYPYGTAPSTPVVTPFHGALVQPMGPVAASAPPVMHLPAAAPAPPPPPPAAATPPPPQEGRRGAPDGDRKTQPN